MFIVKGTVYPYDLMVYCGGKLRLSKILARFGLQIDDVEINEAMCLMFEGNQTLIWLKHKPKDIRDLAVLQHEIFHATCFILEDTGIKYCKETDEAFAYLIQHITHEIYKRLKIVI